MSMSKNIFTIKKDTKFSHRSSNGTFFSGSRVDFKEGVKVVKPDWGISELEFAADFGEFIGWHTMCIRPDMENCHFSGYDCVRYELVTPSKENEEE